MPDKTPDTALTSQPPSAAPGNNLAFGAVWIASAGACAASVGLLVQLASQHANDVMIIFACYAVGFVIVAPLALSRGLTFPATRYPGLQVARALTGVLFFGSLFVALRSIPLVDGILLRSTAPIRVPILLWIFWKQEIPGRLWWAIGLGFVGVALVLQPGLRAWAIGYPIALGSGIAFAFTNILARRINEVGEPLLRTLFYSFLVPTVLMAAPAALTWKAVPPLTWLLMVGTGAGTVAIIGCFVRGLQHGPAHLLAPFGYTSVVFATGLDWLVFGLVPNGLTIGGVLVVTTACILILRMNRSAGGAA